MRDIGVPESVTAHSHASEAVAHASAWDTAHGGGAPSDIMKVAIKELFPDRIALVSSFGTEAAVLLSLAAEIDQALPIMFVDTGKMFGETLRYRDTLIQHLGLRDVRTVRPNAEVLARRDSDMMLWHSDSDACCHIRKTLPLAEALGGFDAWITGRKRFQSATRATIPVFEVQDGWYKVNPLAAWGKADLERVFLERDLPRHPLEADGFLSIGCFTCTERVAPGADPRSGRWSGKDKTECGIHFASLDGSSL